MNNSILLIQSQDSKNSSMGTGFVIYQDEFGSYILTCAHVVEQVIHPKIKNKEAVVKAIGSNETVDLAVLYVNGLYAEPLKLQNKKSQTTNVYLEGYSQFDKKKNQQKKREARILTSVNLENKVDNSSYELLQIIAKDEHEIEAGNSGSPLICKESGKVIGVVSNNRGVKQGYAIAIKHLSDIGLDNLPPLLIENEENEESPFIGLSAFTMEESHLFFGRKQETSRIIRRLSKEDIIVVTGDSGSGKSSLVKAGVIPKYLNGALGLNNNENFKLLSIRPAENPFMELSDAIITLSEVSKMDFKSLNQIQEKILEKAKSPILNALKVIFKNQEFTTLLIFIDQDEE